jgi:hypothetical protein
MGAGCRSSRRWKNAVRQATFALASSAGHHTAPGDGDRPIDAAPRAHLADRPATGDPPATVGIGTGFRSHGARLTISNFRMMFACDGRPAPGADGIVPEVVCKGSREETSLGPDRCDPPVGLARGVEQRKSEAHHRPGRQSRFGDHEAAVPGDEPRFGFPRLLHRAHAAQPERADGAVVVRLRRKHGFDPGHVPRPFDPVVARRAQAGEPALDPDALPHRQCRRHRQPRCDIDRAGRNPRPDVVGLVDPVAEPGSDVGLPASRTQMATVPGGPATRLCNENPATSAPKVRKSKGICPTACALSRTMSAPLASAMALICATGGTSPLRFETWFSSSSARGVFRNTRSWASSRFARVRGSGSANRISLALRLCARRSMAYCIPSQSTSK